MLIADATAAMNGLGWRPRHPELRDEWALGDGSGPTVSGTAADLGWWLTGRGTVDRRAQWGGDAVAPGFVRLSCGIEDTADLVADLSVALAAQH